MRRLILVLLACVLGAAACKSSAADELLSSVEEAVEAERTGDFSAVEGQTIEAVTKALGTPVKSRDFVMGDCCHEFEIELWNTYRPEDPANAEVAIRERHWHFDDHILTVWFHQVDDDWVALDSHLWHKDTDF